MSRLGDESFADTAVLIEAIEEHRSFPWRTFAFAGGFTALAAATKDAVNDERNWVPSAEWVRRWKAGREWMRPEIGP